MQRACAILWRHFWPLGLRHICRNYLINGEIYRKKVMNIKYVFLFSLQRLSKTFPILSGIQRDVVKNVDTSSCKVPVILLGFAWNSSFLGTFSIKCQISGFIKIRPLGVGLFHAARQTDATIFRVDGQVTCVRCTNSSVQALCQYIQRSTDEPSAIWRQLTALPISQCNPRSNIRNTKGKNVKFDESLFYPHSYKIIIYT
jgi:hypothetical protein